MCVNNLSKVALDSAVAGIWTRDLQSHVQRTNDFAAEPRCKHENKTVDAREMSLNLKAMR